MWVLDNIKGWTLKNWCLRTVVLEKTLESPLDCKDTKPVNPKANQPWIFIGRSDAEAEAPILWPPYAKNWLIGKDPEAGRIEGRRRRGWQRMRWLDGITDLMHMSLSKLRRWWRTGKPGLLQSKGSQRVRHDWVTELNWTEKFLWEGKQEGKRLKGENKLWKEIINDLSRNKQDYSPRRAAFWREENSRKKIPEICTCGPLIIHLGMDQCMAVRKLPEAENKKGTWKD